MPLSLRASDDFHVLIWTGQKNCRFRLRKVSGGDRPTIPVDEVILNRLVRETKHKSKSRRGTTTLATRPDVTRIEIEQRNGLHLPCQKFSGAWTVLP